jgi:hypothetical protein
VSVTRPSLDIPFLHFRTQFTLSTRLVAWDLAPLSLVC